MILNNKDIIRFWKKVIILGSDDCWEWQASTGNLYGRIKIEGKQRSAHRVSWTIHFGDPEELWVLHKCDNPLCVNPKHLFLGDNSDNQKDAVKKKRHHQARKTHCPSGHPYDDENTYVVSKTGHRLCKLCPSQRRDLMKQQEIRYCDECGTNIPTHRNRNSIYCSRVCCYTKSNRVAKERRNRNG